MALPLRWVARTMLTDLAGFALASLAAAASTPVDAALKRLKARPKARCLAGALTAAALASASALIARTPVRKAGTAAADEGCESALTCCSVEEQTASSRRK